MTKAVLVLISMGMLTHAVAYALHYEFSHTWSATLAWLDFIYGAGTLLAITKPWEGQ